MNFFNVPEAFPDSSSSVSVTSKMISLIYRNGIQFTALATNNKSSNSKILQMTQKKIFEYHFQHILKHNTIYIFSLILQLTIQFLIIKMII